MTQKFYLHDAATTDTGTLPGSGTISVGTMEVTATGASTNRSMDGSIGPGQTSQALTTSATASRQQTWFRRFLSSPIAAQTINTSVSLHWGASTSNVANSPWRDSYCIAVWRPSDGSLVGRIIDMLGDTAGNYDDIACSSTSEQARTGTVWPSGGGAGQTSSVTAQDEDILVIDVGANFSQGMATAYTNTLFYDGTIEDSATTNAAYLIFGADIAMFTAAAAQIPYINTMPALIAQ